MEEYIYLGDRYTDAALKGKPRSAIRKKRQMHTGQKWKYAGEI